MNPCDRILRGFECVLNDEDFKINSPKARCAIETAQSLMSWSSREENVKSTRINATNTKLRTIKTEALKTNYTVVRSVDHATRTYLLKQTVV